MGCTVQCLSIFSWGGGGRTCCCEDTLFYAEIVMCHIKIFIHSIVILLYVYHWLVYSSRIRNAHMFISLNENTVKTEN